MHNYGAVPRGAYRQLPRQRPRSLGFERYTLDFDGVSNYVTHGVAQPASGTFEAWASFDILSSDKGVSQSIISPLFLNAGSDKITVYGTDWRSFLASTPIISTFYHYVMTWTDKTDVTTSKLFINAIEKAVSAVGSGAFLIWNYLGAGSPTAYFMDGKIAQVRIYGDYVLDPDEVRWNHLNYHNPVHPEKLILWLPMEEGAGLTVYDKSGLGNNGDLLPALTPPTWERVKQYELRAETE